jgi:predicted DNA-binding transcriptional regulator YafY
MLEKMTQQPSLDPYIGKLERFELFSTNQCYYLVACDKNHTAYRVLKMDRTLIERPPEVAEFPQSLDTVSVNSETPVEASHTAKPTLRRLSEFTMAID